MSITSQIGPSGDVVTIRIEGRFDFSAHQAFRETYENLGADINEYRIDLQETSYLDSSALGMLLLLRDYAGGDQANIKIMHCNDEVKKIFAISNFEQLFDIR
ncbi:MAG: STAS domain-containing protein [Oleiphilaceae bacterium]|nr:STAS domain-containing protein [Oleiphilaceae bacterium]